MEALRILDDRYVAMECPFEGREDLTPAHCESLYAMYKFGFSLAVEVAMPLGIGLAQHMIDQWNGQLVCWHCEEVMAEIVAMEAADEAIYG